MAPLLSTRRASPSCLHAPRPAVVASRACAWCACRLPRTDAHGCGAGLRPPPTRPAAWEASVGGVRGFRLPGPGACFPRASSSASAAGSLADRRPLHHRALLQMYPSLHSKHNLTQVFILTQVRRYGSRFSRLRFTASCRGGKKKRALGRVERTPTRFASRPCADLYRWSVQTRSYVWRTRHRHALSTLRPAVIMSAGKTCGGTGLLRGVGSCHQRTTLTGKAGGGVLVRSIAISSRLRANALAVMLRLRPSVVAPLPLLLQQPLQLELRPATIRQKVLLLMLLFQTLELPCKPLYHPHYLPQHPPLHLPQHPTAKSLRCRYSRVGRRVYETQRPTLVARLPGSWSTPPQSSAAMSTRSRWQNGTSVRWRRRQRMLPICFRSTRGAFMVSRHERLRRRFSSCLVTARQ